MRPSGKTILVVLLLASAGTALMGPGLSGSLRGWTSFALAPLGDAGMYVTTSINSHVSNLSHEEISQKEAIALLRENELLRGRIVGLSRQCNDLWARSEDIQHLRASFSPLADIPCEIIPARVVAEGSLPYSNSRLVSRRGKGKIRQDAPVTTMRLLTDRSKALPSKLSAITATQFVGRVVNSGPFTAWIRLVTDRGFTVHASVSRVVDPLNPREIEVVVDGHRVLRPLTEENNYLVRVGRCIGDGGGGMTISDVRVEHKIRAGDYVFTRGDDPLLPVMVAIGKVSEVIADKKNPQFMQLQVKPLADLPSLRNVYIIYNRGMIEPPPPPDNDDGANQ